MILRRPFVAFLMIALLTGYGSLTATARAADEAPADKSSYTVFNATPVNLMRDLAPDRPDLTESPFTVDAGHCQLELSFFEWAKDSDYESLQIVPFNLKVGLTNNMDLQFLLAPYNRQRAFSHTDQGVSDAAVRLKINLWGNDGEGVWHTAFGVMPYVTIPFGADAFTADSVQGGVIFPFAVTLPGEFELGAMAEFDFVSDGAGGRDTLLTHSATLSHKLGQDLEGYIEYAGIVDLDGDLRYRGFLDLGLVYEVNKNISFDCGVNIGLTRAAENVRIFAGMTVRM